MEWSIQYKMAAWSKYEVKDKFECLHYIALTSPVEFSYVDGSVLLSVKNPTKQGPSEEHFLGYSASLQL